VPDAPISNGDLNVCVNALRPLTVNVPSSIQVNWYDAPTGGNLLLENNTSYNTTIAGTYYAEAKIAAMHGIRVKHLRP